MKIRPNLIEPPESLALGPFPEIIIIAHKYTLVSEYMCDVLHLLHASLCITSAIRLQHFCVICLHIYHYR